MADNTELNAMSGGNVIATDDITNVHYQIIKLAFGALNSATLVTTTDRFPVALGSNTGVDIGDVDVLSIAAGNNNIGDVDIASIAAGDNNIGNVDIVTVPADPFGLNADAASATGSISAKLRFLAATGIAGMTTLPAGTNAIGKLSSNDGVDIGDVGIQAGTAAIGKLLPPDIDVTTHTNYAKKYYTNAGAVTDGIIWSPAAGKRWHVVTMYIQTSAAATVTLEDDKAGGDDPVWKGELAANGGAVLSFTEKYPLASGEDAADLMVTTSAGNIYITVVGFEI